MKKAEAETHVLEINLISGQGLQPPSGTLRRMKTYAVAWADPNHKVRTRIDKLGSENPTWNDRFLFKVSSEFLARETSGVTFEIYAVGSVRDHLIGTVRLILSNFLDVDSKIPSFTALQIRRPSGRFHGVLNVAAAVNRDSDWSTRLGDLSAIGFEDLMGGGESFLRSLRRRTRSAASLTGNLTKENFSSSCNESVNSHNCGGGGDSLPPSPILTSPERKLTSSMRATSWPEERILKEMNGVTEMAAGPLGGVSFLCGLMTKQWKVQSAEEEEERRGEVKTEGEER